MIVVGHRTAGHLAPENSLAGVREAIALGLEWIELDVHEIQGELAAWHDHTLDGTPGYSGWVAGADWQLFRGLPIGEGEYPPTVAEMLREAAGRIRVNFEVKAAAAGPLLLSQLDSAVTSGIWNATDFLVSSFDLGLVSDLKSRGSGYRLGAIVYGVPLRLVEDAEAAGADTLVADIDFMTSALVDDARRRNLSVWAYTVNAPCHLAKARDLGVDAIISDRPATMREALRQSEAVSG